MTTQDLAKTCYGRVYPSKVENLADIPTSELLKALRLTSVEEAIKIYDLREGGLPYSEIATELQDSDADTDFIPDETNVRKAYDS